MENSLIFSFYFSFHPDKFPCCPVFAYGGLFLINSYTKGVAFGILA